MYCKKCHANFSDKEQFNKHTISENCFMKTSEEYNDFKDNNIVYTNYGDPIREDDDISEFLNQDDDDYVPGSCD